MQRSLVIIAVAAVLVWKLATHVGTVELGPGVSVFEPPLQTMISDPEPFSHADYTITPLADFHLRAKVLARKRYYFGREADLSPIDLALGWQQMSDEKVLDRINISQSDRWYLWNVDEFPISRREIETMSANMHMIPADGEIDSLLKKVRPGEVIEIDGYLVGIVAEDGWRWSSSLSREDKGGGGCEVVWVRELMTVEP